MFARNIWAEPSLKTAFVDRRNCGPSIRPQSGISQCASGAQPISYCQADAQSMQRLFRCWR